MELHYSKNDNSTLFNDFNNSDLVNMNEPQSFIPLYTKFFSLNDTNYNHINLNHKYNITSIKEKYSENIFSATLYNSENNAVLNDKPVFFKLSALFDPIKFMIGKYDNDCDFLTLPKFTAPHKHKKLDDPNNSAYVDSFFTYLTSQMLHKENFIHGLDFYGSFLGIKNNYKVNIADDIEYMQDSVYFNNHNNVSVNNITYTLDNMYLLEDSQNQSRRKKDKLKLSTDLDEKTVLNLSDISDIKELDTIFKTSDVSTEKTETLDLMFECKNKSKPSQSSRSSSSSSCSSRTSNTDTESCNNSDSETNSQDSGSERGSDSCSSFSHSQSSGSSYTTQSTATEDEVLINISQFPVQLIALEKCDQTLDHLLLHSTFSDKEWDSMVLQVLMTLITYQNVFDLTHNDLHTNNIMYNKTDKQFLNYRVGGKYYKVPTFGRIYKIIDFGRAIYKFRGKLLCSDSFHPKGDAATQYNCEPYVNKNKPIIEPNKSFDLCRLGCSLFDFIVEELEDNKQIEDIKDINNISSSIKKIILGWCQDDKGRNVIYKNNGDERYPEFKLYKMIARTVNKHTPHAVLNNPYFSKYIVTKKKINTKKLLDIDNYPVLQ